MRIRFSISLFVLLLFFITSTAHEIDLTKESKKIALCITATGKYDVFANALIESARKFFLTNHHVTYFVFGDGHIVAADDVKVIHQNRLGWPFDTLMRFEFYLNHANELENYDYIFASDADMLFVAPIGDELLGDLVGTIHPGFYNQKRESFSYEKQKKSTACISPREGQHYFAGGFYGGAKNNFLKLVEQTSINIRTDLAQDFIAVWHDESHLNRYFIDNPPSVKLSPAYCYPENWKIPFEKKLLALDKNHAEMRK